jgi:hypothetical protein
MQMPLYLGLPTQKRVKHELEKIAKANQTVEVIATARVEMRTDGSMRLASVFGELDTDVPREQIPKVIESKLALLHLIDVGSRIDGVGKRQSTGIFYLSFTIEDYEQTIQDLRKLRSNARNGGLASKTGAPISG